MRMRDIWYIIKRIIIGVGIALILGFLRAFPVHALTSNFDSVLMCSNNMGCSTSLSLPYSYAYSDSARINFTGINLIQGKTYNINFSMTLTSPSFSFNLDYPQLFVIDSSNNPVRAYPDRGNSLQVNNLGNNNYSVNWSFELDNTGGNFTSAYVIFVFTSSYNQNIYSTIINSSNFLYYDLSDPTGNQDIINNQNNNTQIIVNNNNSNTQDIINNQNENTEKEIESQNVCSIIDLSSIVDNNKALSATGGDFANNTAGITDYISLDGVVKLSKLTNDSSLSNRICFYRNNININSVISCFQQNEIAIGEITIPDNAKFVRFTIVKSSNAPTYSICKNGNQAINDTNKSILEKIIDLPNQILQLLIRLFIPDDFSFLDDFKQSLSNKLGFIAAVPIALFDFTVGLLNASWEEFNSITLPSISIFGYNFWQSQTISLTEAINIFRPFRYVTDVLCVVLCVRYLVTLYHKFFGDDVS